MFTLYQLRIFQVVVQEGSISKAAERLFLTQPAVSQHVHALETEMGAKLFSRGRRGVTLTPAGSILVDYSRCLFRLVDEAKQAVAQAAHVKEGKLRIGASPGVGTGLLPDWIFTFQRQNPDIHTSLKTEITPLIVKFLLRKHLDIGIVEGNVTTTDVKVVPLWDEEIVVVVGPGHRWWGKAHIAASELATERFITRENGSLTLAWGKNVLAGYGITPQIVAQFDTPASEKQAVRLGLGIALLPCFLIQDELKRGQLYAVRLEEGPLVRTLKLLWHAGSLRNYAVGAFVRYLAGEFPNVPIQIADDAANHLLEQLKNVRERTGRIINHALMERCS